ncbi:hypothetical protein [Pseudoclavibacter sp. RFBA6]|uniref:hypothetical protein n=1 Tax=Pseudoclavibacter sp. RFBA6 TaxID=2080573 RepID=UPI000CE74418|nr:hypothetical protein [Pseudoclavibacter sp. RFBA6]PPG40512.1 hypothetical protein C5C17_06820 [Pseudoclavibacter sp. RFBA6]
MRSPAIGSIIGAVAGAFGLAPWFATGANLPGQNLWSAETLPGDMPIAFLPIHQYFVLDLVALLVLGGTLAGFAVRLLRERATEVRRAAAIGLAGVQLLAVFESFVALAGGLAMSGSLRALLFFAGMLVGTLAVVGASQAVYWLTSSRSAPISALGLCLGVIPIGTWLGLWYMLSVGPAGGGLASHELVRWTPGLAVGVVLGMLGVSSLARIAVWAGSLAAVWLLPVVLGSVQYALGTRNAFGDVYLMADLARTLLVPLAGELAPPALAAAAIAGLLAFAVHVGRAHGRLSPPPRQQSEGLTAPGVH